MKVLSGAVFLLLVTWMSFSNASPLESASYDDVVYLADSESNSVQRYSLVSGTFLAPLSLSQNPLAIHVDVSGIYVSYGTEIVRLDLSGANETYYRTISQSIGDIESNDNYLFLAGYGYLQVVNKSTGTLVEAPPLSGISPFISLSMDGKTLFATWVGGSPQEIFKIPIADDGTLGLVMESPYHGAYDIGVNPQAFPTQGRVIETTGNVYNTSNLTFAGNLGGSYQAIDFWQGLPIVLRDGKLFSYNKLMQETGVYTLSITSSFDLAVYENQVFVFGIDGNADISVEAIDITSLTPADPLAPADPTDLEYIPDGIALDADRDTVYLLSKAQLGIFRWSLTQGAYLEPIALENAPNDFAYSAAENRIYLSYSNGAINYIDLETGEENLFAVLGSRVTSIHATGNFLIAKDDTNWSTLNVFNSAGELTDSVTTWPTNKLYWDAATQSIYYLTYYSPMDLEVLRLDAQGKFSGYKSSPYHDSDGWAEPIRISETGKFIGLATGRVVVDASLTEVADVSITNGLTDLAWMHGNLFTLKGIDNNTYSQLVRWDANFDSDTDSIKEILGEPVGLIPIASINKLLVVFRQNGKPAFELFEFLETDFDSDGVPDSQDLFPVDASETLDFDRDGIGDLADTDDDNDGFSDEVDAFPENPDETTDTDSDGLGNNADTDDDNDGVVDEDDRFPLDASESSDMDNDNIGDNSDPDVDGDYVPNDQDAFPYDPMESLDTDLDNIGNNADIDDDNDGVDDEYDLYPLDATESSDMDWDGIGDNSDPDRDGDSILNALDQFPNDPHEWLDTDLDGVGNNTDTDDDGDGVADNLDVYPLDANESRDSDGDGIGDNSDPDRDGDGVPNEQDLFPNNASEWLDSDSDGIGNNADPDDDNDSVADSRDFYPMDASKSNINANDFLPLARGNRWIYDQFSAPVKPGSDKKIANQTIMPLEFPYGHKTYLKVVNNQLQLFGFYFANVDVGFGPFSTDFMFNKGVDLMSTNSQSGKGTVNISPTYGKKDMNWSVSVDYLGSESLVLPAGQYNGMHTRVSFTGSTTVEGQQIQLSYFVDYWFAEGVGLVQLSDNGGSMRLVSATITEPDVDNPDTPSDGGSGGGGGGGGSVNGLLLFMLLLLLGNISARENLKNRFIKRNY